MKEFIILVITLSIIGVAAYQNYIKKSENTSDVIMNENNNKLDNEEYIKLFNNGISMKDLGDLIVIKQNPNDATIIILKEDLDNIIGYLHRSIGIESITSK